MLAFFRAFAKSPIAVVLMGLLIISFAIWGVRDMFKAHISDAVVQAGSREVSSGDFKKIFDRQLRNAQQQSGQAITAEDAVGRGLDRQILQEMASYESLEEILKRAGIRPAAQLVVDQLRQSAAFFNPVTGAFDKTAYENLLAQNNTSPAEYEKGVKDDIATRQFLAGMTIGMKAPLTYAAVIAALQDQSRDVDYLILDQRQVGAIPTPTDADLQKFIKDNAQVFTRPETRMISLVRFSAAALAPSQTISDADIQKQFDYEKARLSTPEKRTFVEIPAKDAAQAAQISARLTKDEDATAVAKAFAAKPINYPDATKATVADAGVANAVFAMHEGETSGPIKGDFGYAVVKLVSITPARPATLEEARPDILKTLQLKAAQDKVYDQVQKYEDAHDSGAPMAQAAAKAGIKVYDLGPLTADGKIAGQPVTGLTTKMVTDAFATAQGQETDVVDLGNGEYYAVRVDKVSPQALATLDEVRPIADHFWRQQQMQKALDAKAAPLEARLKKGEGIDAVARSAGAAPLHLVGLTQANAVKQQQLGGRFMQAVFSGKPGDAFTQPTNIGVAVGRIAAVEGGDLKDVVADIQRVRPQLDVALAQNGMTDMIATAARAKVRPRIDEKLARRAVGVSADDVPDETAPAKPAKAAGKAK